MLAMTPDERLLYAVRSSINTDAMLRSMRKIT